MLAWTIEPKSKGFREVFDPNGIQNNSFALIEKIWTVPCWDFSEQVSKTECHESRQNVNLFMDTRTPMFRWIENMKDQHSVQGRDWPRNGLSSQLLLIFIHKIICEFECEVKRKKYSFLAIPLGFIPVSATVFTYQLTANDYIIHLDTSICYSNRCTRESRSYGYKKGGNQKLTLTSMNKYDTN